ncbi:MAG: SBBP repeat-containing protein [Pyrinomonadaceae bacterium]|nr:SBBP repeat-containing protein [Pyrinomonadaceae bacterium]
MTKLSPSGSSLVYSTFLGGDNAETVFGLAVGSDGRACVVGVTESSRFRTSPFPTPRSGSAAHRTLNGASQWSASASGLTANAVNSFAIEPGNSNSVYAGTNTGVFRSINAGVSWSLTGSASPSSAPLYTNVVLIDPSNPSIIYAGVDSGIYKSTNGGTLFAPKNDGLADRFINALAIDPTTPTTLYAGTTLGVFKSTNGGDTWAEANNGLGGNPPKVNEVVIDPTNSAIVYLGTAQGMYKTINGGALWSSINSGPLFDASEITGLTVDPLNPSVLYASAISLPSHVKTTNGGATWVGSGSLTYTIDGVVVYAHITALAIDPVNPTILYAATFGGGVFKSTNGAANWSQSNTGLTRVNVNAVAVDRNAPAILFAGTTIGGDAFAARFNPSESALEYLVNFGGNGHDQPSGVALDADGNAYIAGTTTSPNFPLVNAFQSVQGNSFGDAFVAKLSSSGTNFVYSTYLGGSSTDSANGIAVREGSAYVVGHTYSPNFPVANAFKPVLAQDDKDAFVTKLNASGSALDFSTYLGGNNGDEAFGVAVDSLGGVYITGSTTSSDFPTLAVPQSTYGGGTSDAFVTELNAAGTQLVYSTYLGGTSSEQSNGVAVDPSGNAYVIGATSSNNFPTVNPFQAVRRGNDAFFTKIGPVGPTDKRTVHESQYLVNENVTGAQVIVSRTGVTSSGTTVGYTTVDTSGSNNCSVINGNASSRCDYQTTVGTLQFASGETSKTISIPIIDDSYAEGSENFTITLSNATGASLGSPSTATITINDNETVNGPNPIDQAGFFVRQHYIDFLNWEPDAGGIGFWSDQITSCGTDIACIELRRINVSAAFFISIEFQQTGYLVYRMYKTAYGNLAGTPVPVRLNEFLPDTQQIGLGVVVGQTGWEQVLENNKQAFAAVFVARSRFTTAYPTALTSEQFVDALFTKAWVTASAGERMAAIGEFGGAPTTADMAARGRALRRVAENQVFAQQEFNKAFVLMQYFGYLRRNPNDAPEATLDFQGYNFWLAKLNQFNGNFINAEMVKAFIVSGEYRQRFGP